MNPNPGGVTPAFVAEATVAAYAFFIPNSFALSVLNAEMKSERLETSITITMIANPSRPP